MFLVKIGGASDLLQDVLFDAQLFEVVGDNEVYEATGGGRIVYLRNSWWCLPGKDEATETEIAGVG